MSAEADLLRRAAALVRREGGEATPGPWTRAMKTRTKSAIVAPVPEGGEVHQRGRDCVGVCSVPHFDGGGGFVRARSGRDLDWIALVGPQVAEPLAAWLDYAAEIAVWSPTIPMLTMPLALARALLGEAEETTP